MTRTWLILGPLGLLASCELEPTPATQVMVVLNSDMREGDELDRVRFEVFDAEGKELASAAQEFALREGGGEGTHELPLSFSLIPPRAAPAERFRLVATGFRGGAKLPFVEQKVIAAFVSEQSLLLEVFLGRVCEDELCDAESTCYVADEADVRAGECGAIPERTLDQVAPGKAIDQAEWPDPLTPSGDGGTSGDTDAGGGADADMDGGEPASDGGELVSDGSVESGALCDELELSRDLCELPDTNEPNDSAEEPSLLELDGTCTSTESTLRGDDVDVYRIFFEKSDPGLITLLDGTPELGTLELAANPWPFYREERIVGNTTQIAFSAEKGKRYHWSVRGEELACQPYALQVDAAFCTDQYEDNDELEEAKSLTFVDGKVTIQASKGVNDDDYFEIVLEKHDPFLVSGSYTVDASSITDLSVWWHSPIGGGGDDNSTRVGETEQWFLPRLANAGDHYRVSVRGESTPFECIDYELTIDTRFCTDDEEDNDVATQAHRAPSGEEMYELTVYNGDDDFFDVTGLSGACTLTYMPVHPAGPNLNLSAHSGTSSIRGGQVSTAPSGEKTIVLSLASSAGNPVPYVRVSSTDNTRPCQPYTLRCE